MQYLYYKDAGKSGLVLTGDEHHYVFKVRRQRAGEIVALRNLNDEYIYLYRVESLDKREANIALVESKELSVSAKKDLHIGWCLIELKNIEKILPSLNEIGVYKITFITCKRTQQNIKLDLDRLKRIILNSSQQCGRSKMMEFEIASSLEQFLDTNQDSYMLNFSNKNISKSDNIGTIVIGCEGGFTPSELSLFDEKKIVGLDTQLVLRSESAVCAVASKILL